MSELAEDYKEYREKQKKVRDLRQEAFEENILPQLKAKYEVFTGSNGQYIIDSDFAGVIDYFPKSKRLLQREGNKWRSDGLSWIIKNLL